MITYCTGNILDDNAHALVNPVNCVGTSGAGLAKQFAVRFPGFIPEYREDCCNGLLVPGKIAVYRSFGLGPIIARKPWIVCFPTKQHWRDQSSLLFISEGLKSLTSFVKFQQCSCAIPKLGCGLGGLDWRIVRLLILDAFKDSKTDVRIYGEAP